MRLKKAIEQRLKTFKKEVIGANGDWESVGRNFQFFYRTLVSTTATGSKNEKRIAIDALKKLRTIHDDHLRHLVDAPEWLFYMDF